MTFQEMWRLCPGRLCRRKRQCLGPPFACLSPELDAALDKKRQYRRLRRDLLRAPPRIPGVCDVGPSQSFPAPPQTAWNIGQRRARTPATMALLVKICGLKTPEALDAALDAGADMVGFVFFPPSPRHLGARSRAGFWAGGSRAAPRRSRCRSTPPTRDR